MSKIKLPQPLGIYAGPPGGLVLPIVSRERDKQDQEVELIKQLLSGAQVKLPQAWSFYEDARGGNIDAALTALSALEAELSARASKPESESDCESESRSEQGWLIDFNRFVLNGDVDLYKSLAAQLSGAELGLLEATAYLHGLSETPGDPANIALAEAELKAYLLSTWAHFKLSHNPVEALQELAAAAELVEERSPIFAARLHGEWATTCGEQVETNDAAIKHYRRALDLLEDTAFQELRAELALELGMCCQLFSEGRRDKLLAATYAYQQALLYFHREGPQPYNYGLAHMNLALVYLSMPMNDEAERLRPAIAVQSLREALKVFTRESHPKMWASATLNLANALQHVPSTHNEANLWEAVALYQDILEVRKESDDALSYARVLANQGNALAHLGAFSRAEPILIKALQIFQANGDDSAAVIKEMLQEIGSRRSEVGNI